MKRKKSGASLQEFPVRTADMPGGMVCEISTAAEHYANLATLVPE